jgi:phage regulator Rha-like protein
MNEIIQNKLIENKLLKYKNELVLIDSDVAELYGVKTRDINKAVLNNSEKFPKNYTFELTKEEFEILRCKFSTAKFSKRRTLPKVFTEKGLYMLATILKSKVATQTTLQIIETFFKVRELSKNINMITKTEDESLQKKLAKKTSSLLEDIIEIEDENRLERVNSFTLLGLEPKLLCEVRTPMKAA